MKPKLTFFLSHPIQYISPLLQELAKNVDLDVYYYSDLNVIGGFDKGFGQSIKWDIPLLEGYKSNFLRNFSINNSMNTQIGDAINPGVLKVLWKTKSTIVVVNSWTYFSDLLVIFTAWIFGKKVWLRAENPLNQELLKKGWKQKIKYYFLNYFVFKIFVQKFLYIGSENKKFFHYFSVKDSHLIFTPYAVDNEKFKKAYEENKLNKNNLKKELGISATGKVIMYSGKYIEKKRPLDLLKAFELLNDSEFNLVLMGEGPLRNELENYIVKQQLKNVILTGFINQSEISKYYSIADVFVMCSGIGETWGLSANEAMNFKLPLILSDTTGSSYDLVISGKNGFIYKEGDIESLSNCLKKIFSNKFNLLDAGNISNELINDFNIQKIVNNILLNLSL